MKDAERRGIWAGRTERRLTADTTVKEWCELNKVSKSNLYKWMAIFRGEEPGRFAGKNSETSGWVKVARRDLADAKAIVPVAANPAEEAPRRPRGRRPRFSYAHWRAAWNWPYRPGLRNPT